MSQVKDSKISMLVHQYEFQMEDHEIIDQMFGRFQTIINNLKSLGKTYDNYDHITKIFRSHVTALRVFKDLKKLPVKELFGTLKVHVIELNEDEGQRKGKSITLKAQKT
ncbi:hypothetical protein CR513_26511, partial [Mucuna pruriens]